ncbi:hypothetical protein KM043_012489 [Ampulex compressa]|nr:hypothetical protein KM043_012489 [Ampulex compressa]
MKHKLQRGGRGFKYRKDSEEKNKILKVKEHKLGRKNAIRAQVVSSDSKASPEVLRPSYYRQQHQLHLQSGDARDATIINNSKRMGHFHRQDGPWMSFLPLRGA